ncbi:MAG: murein biosynthesis integral membrane protein MurJ [Candidatus Omnitrophota bacterium]
MFKRIIKDTSIVSLATLFSRFLGLIRDILIANFFGTSSILEAFLVAFRIPNLLRSALGEGFSDSVAVPVLSEYRKDKYELFNISSHLLSIFIIVLSIVTAAGIIFSKYLVLCMAPGFLSDQETFLRAVSFTRITFLYIFLIGVSTCLTAILYSLKKFFIPAFTPAFLNIAFILGIPFFFHSLKNNVLLLCVVAGGILQVIFPFMGVLREGFRFKFRLREALSNSQIIRMFKLFVPRVWSSIVYQLSVLLDTILASFANIVGSGAICAIHYSSRFIQLPIALIALPIFRVTIVDLSEYHKYGRMDEFKKLFVFSFQNLIFFIIPIAVVFMVFGRGILDVILVRGGFKADSLEITASAFFFYSMGLLFFCAIKVLLGAFYSLKDTKTPAKTTAISLLVNAAFSILLMFPFKIAGVALGSSIAAMFNCFLLYYFLIKRIGPIDWEDTLVQLLKIISLSIIAAFFAGIAWNLLFFNKYIKLMVSGFIFCAIFAFGACVFGFRQIIYIKRKFS